MQVAKGNKGRETWDRAPEGPEFPSAEEPDASLSAGRWGYLPFASDSVLCWVVGINCPHSPAEDTDAWQGCPACLRSHGQFQGKLSFGACLVPNPTHLHHGEWGCIAELRTPAP